MDHRKVVADEELFASYRINPSQDMNIKNKFFNAILVLLLAVFIIPSVAFASWWNPFSWFKKKDVPVVTTPIKPTPVTPIVGRVQQSQLNNPGSKPGPDYGSPELNTLLGGSTKPTTKNKSVIKTTITTQGSDRFAQPVESSDITNSRENLKSLFQDQIAVFKGELFFVTKTAIKGKISSLKDNIANDQGIEIGNPDYAPTGQYLDGLTQNQIDFENKYLDATTSADNWVQTAESEQEAILAQLPNLTTKDQLDNEMKNYQFYKDNLQKVADSLDAWSQSADEIQAKIDGITAGIDSKLKASLSSLPTVAVPSPQTFVPSNNPPFQLNCITSPKNLIGEVETKCY